MIIVRLCGGLGNQMFQYALGRRLALDHKVPLWLNISPFRKKPRRGSPPSPSHATYRLCFFRIQASLLSAGRAAFMLPYPRRLSQHLAWIPHWPGVVRTVREQGLAFNPQVLESSAATYLDGYWQTEKYFAKIDSQIRTDFSLATPMTEARQLIATRMQDNESISVHIRRGDYVTDSSANAFHGTCSPEWYAQAMNRMADSVKNPRFFIFSDDPVWVRSNLPIFNGTVFIDPQSDGRDYEDMHLMSKCRHHIIANSSFSWWGAWLNPSPVKKVIAPERWFLAPTETHDRTPLSWTRL